MGRVAHNRRWHGTETSGAEFVFAPIPELAVNLVPPVAALGAARLQLHVLQPEAEQHRLLGPLVHVPFAAFLPLGHPEPAPVKRAQRFLYGLADLTSRLRRYFITLLPGGFDGGFKLFPVHGSVLLLSRIGDWP